MYRVHPHAWNLFFRLLDALVIVGGLQLAVMIRDGGWPQPPVQFWISLMAPITLVVFELTGVYSGASVWSLDNRLRRLGVAWTSTLLIGFIVAYFLSLAGDLPRLALGPWLIAVSILLPGARVLYAWAASARHRRGEDVSRALLVGTPGEIEGMAKHLAKHPEYGVLVVGYVAVDQDGLDTFQFDDPEIEGAEVRGHMDDLEALCEEHVVQQVIVCTPLSRVEDVTAKAMNLLERSSAVVSYAPSSTAFALFNHRVNDIAGQPIIDLTGNPLDHRAQILKWLEDKILAACFLLLASPVMIAIAIGIKLTSRGPVFFVQTRHGYLGKPIKVYKFRSMRQDDAATKGSEARADGSFAQAQAGDDRITKFGHFLRKTSLDELPQFINVLQGRMSIVGPRPHAIKMNKDYSVDVTDLMKRHYVRPGITGLAQISGQRGETRTIERMRKRVDYDLQYMQNWSLWLDLKIIFLTIFKGFINNQP